VSRHAAADGSPVHPLVAEALARRTPDAHGTHRDQDPGREGGLGWPGPASPGRGLGWPGDLPTESAAGGAGAPPEVETVDPGSPEEPGPADVPADDAAAGDGSPAARTPAAAARRRGWRRLIGPNRAA
jgi:hypothetical protein